MRKWFESKGFPPPEMTGKNSAPRVILITGCRSGIGLATAVALARAGHVVYAGLRDISTGEELRHATDGLPVHPLQLDISDPVQRQAAVSRIIGEQARIDVLINNAGIGIGGFLEELEEDELRSVFEATVFGSWALTKDCLPAMRQAGKGTVVMISSLSGRMAIPGLGSYCSAKFALEGMSETWRHELRPFGIDVILVQPGAYRTDMIGAKRKLCRASGASDSAYKSVSANVARWYQRMVVDKAADPSHLGQAIVALLEEPNPRLRYPIGPSTTLRSLALRFLPFWVIERTFRRVLNGDAVRSHQ